MNKKIVLCFFVFFIITSPKCHSQNQQKVDSLLQVLKKANEDTGKVKTLNAVSRELWQLGNYENANKHANDALVLSEKIKYKAGVINALSNLGTISWYQGDYPNALKNYFASLKICEEVGDKISMGNAYGNIANVYQKQGNYELSLQNNFSSLKVYEETGDKYNMAISNSNIGIIYAMQGKPSEALKNFSNALEYFKEINDKRGISMSYRNIGIMYVEQDKFIDALKSQLSALQIEEEMGNKEGIKSSYLNLGRTYTKLNDFSKSKKYLTDALTLSKELNSKEGIQTSYQNLSELNSAMGDYKQALENYELSIAYKDSLLNEINSNQTAELQTKYESEKKEKEIALLTKDKEIQNIEIKKQTLLKNSLIGGLGLVLILVFFGYRTYRTRQLLKLQTLRNKIASDLHDDVGSTLSSISIFSEMAKAQSSEVSPMLEQIGDSSRKMLDAMADIVWTINPENDQFEKIILRMKSFAYELLGAKKIDFEFEADENVSQLKLPMDTRKNLYLIFKEATNNMVKYSDANKASYSISGNKEKLAMFIRDNGKGFDVNQESQGNGLKNMKKRAQEIGANLLIESEAGTGTTLQLILNLA